jgi:hypothetical protein
MRTISPVFKVPLLTPGKRMVGLDDPASEASRELN